MSALKNTVQFWEFPTPEIKFAWLAGSFDFSQKLSSFALKDTFNSSISELKTSPPDNAVSRRFVLKFSKGKEARVSGKLP